MTKNEELIRLVIIDFESGKLSSDFALIELKKLAHNPVDLYELENYWRSENLENYVKRLAIIPMDDWTAIDDDRAFHLIDEILDNLDSDDIIYRNSEALEKRFAKSTGTITSMIFVDDIDDRSAILAELKKDTRILL